jgi:hypothetical protein
VRGLMFQMGKEVRRFGSLLERPRVFKAKGLDVLKWRIT